MPVSPKVLIIDEDQDSRVEARRSLQRAEFEIVGQVGFGQEAITAATENRPNVILMAVEEPVTRPLDTAEVLANVMPDTPIIFYSSINQPEAVRRAVLFGARDYLLKPLQAVRTGEAIQQALEFVEKQQLRRSGQVPSSAVRGTVITVAGAKGGIGKSVIAVNLALALRTTTKARVVLVDADTHFGDVATMLDITPAHTATPALRDIGSIDRARLETYLVEAQEGLKILAGPREDRNVWEEAGPQAPGRLVDLLSYGYDFVVADTSGAMDSYVKSLVDNSTVILLVTSGEVSSVRDTKTGLGRFRSWGVPDEKIKVVLNRGTRSDGLRLVDLEQTLERSVFWEMPRDLEVPKSVQMGRPVVIDKPRTTAARHIMALATAIGGNIRDDTRQERSLGRVFGRGRLKSASL